MQQKLNIISNCIIPHNIVLLGSLKERSMKNNDWKERLNIVYSTNPDYNYEMNDDEEQATLPLHNNACAYSWTARTGVAKSSLLSQVSWAPTII